MPLTSHFEWDRNVFPLFRGRARAALRQLAPQIEDTAKGLCPVDSGALRSTNTVFVMDTGVRLVIEAGGPAPEFGTYVYYSGLVHDGTDRMPPRPWLQQTLNAWTPSIRQAVARSWRPF